MISFDYINTDVIINKIYQHPLLKDINPDTIIDNIVSVLKLAGLPNSYKKTDCVIQIKEYKGRINSPVVNILSVDLKKGKQLTPMVSSTSGYSGTSLDPSDRNRRLTYSINNRVIHSSIRECELYVIFETFVTDELGHPMIPNSESLIKAIIEYIKVDYFRILFDLNKIPENTLARAEREYAFYIGQAQSSAVGLNNDDDIEAFINGHTKFFEKRNDHSDRGGSLSDRQYLKRQ